MRLIDANEIKNLFNAQVERGATDLFDAFEDALQDAQAVDAVVVTRCKDCARCGFCGEATNLEVMGFYGYCSRGKRKEDA